MKKIVVVVFIFLSFYIYPQNIKEKLYLEALKFILDENVFDVSKIGTILNKDTCYFICRADNFIEDTEKRLNFNFKKYYINVWPEDHIFFYDITSFAKINTFEVKKETIEVNIQIILNRKTVEKIYVIIAKNEDGFKIEKLKNK